MSERASRKRYDFCCDRWITLHMVGINCSTGQKRLACCLFLEQRHSQQFLFFLHAWTRRSSTLTSWPCYLIELDQFWRNKHHDVFSARPRAWSVQLRKRQARRFENLLKTSCRTIFSCGVESNSRCKMSGLVSPQFMQHIQRSLPRFEDMVTFSFASFGADEALIEQFTALPLTPMQVYITPEAMGIGCSSRVSIWRRWTRVSTRNWFSDGQYKAVQRHRTWNREANWYIQLCTKLLHASIDYAGSAGV